MANYEGIPELQEKTFGQAPEAEKDTSTKPASAKEADFAAGKENDPGKERSEYIQYLLRSRAVGQDFKDTIEDKTLHELALEHAAAKVLDELAGSEPLPDESPEKIIDKIEELKEAQQKKPIDENRKQVTMTLVKNPERQSQAKTSPEPAKPVIQQTESKTAKEEIKKEKSETKASKPKVSYAGPEDLKETMKQVLNQEAPENDGWQEFHDLHKLVKEKYGVSYVPSNSLGLEGNTQALKKLDYILPTLDKESVKGKMFYAGKNLKEDALINFDGTADDAEIKKQIMDKIGLAQENPEQGKDNELRSRLAEARTNYLKAKKASEKMGMSGTPAEKVYQAAQAEYEKTSAEYVGKDINRYLEERNELQTARLMEYGKLDARWYKQMDKVNRKITDFSLYNGLKKIGKENLVNFKGGQFIAKNLNGRVLIGAALLGGGMYMGSWIAGVAARRVFVSATSGLGYRQMLESARKYWTQKPMSAEEIAKLDSLDEVEDRMIQIEARQDFDGRTHDYVISDPEYQLLQKKQQELLVKFEDHPDAAGILSKRIGLGETMWDEKRRKEKRQRKATMAAGLAAGAATGLASTWLGSGAAKSQTEYSPEMSSAGAVETPGTPKSDVELKPETPPTPEAVKDSISVGKRGVEGTLIDLGKSNDPLDTKMYAKMMAKLREEYPGSPAKDPELIHRAVAKIAQEKGYTIDGGGKDLSRIAGAEIKINPDGTINLNIKDNDFLKSPASSAAAPEAENPQQPAAEETSPAKADKRETPIPQDYGQPKIGHDAIKVEPLDFSAIGGESVTTEQLELTRKETLFSGALEELKHYSKTSDALKKYLESSKEYNAFMKEVVGLNTRELNKIQTLSVNEFLSSYNSDQMSAKQIREYSILERSISNYLQAHPAQDSATRSQKLREFLIRLAVERKTK